MKKIVSFIALVSVLLTALMAFFACAKSQGGKEPGGQATEKTPAEIYDLVKEVAGFGDMAAYPTSKYFEEFGVDPAKLEDSVWYMSSNPAVNADEVAIFKVKDASYAEELAGICSSRIERQKQLAATYSPEEAVKLENTEVKVVGSWVYYCVGDNYDAMMDVLGDNIR